MKRLRIFLLFTLILSACAAQAEPTTDPEVLAGPETQLQERSTNATPIPLTSDILNTDFEDATSVRNQLMYGTLLLEGTDFAVTPEQAGLLLPLYQGLLALISDSTSVSEEVNAVQNQIMENMTSEQLTAIADLQITTEMLNAFYLEHGLTLPEQDPDSTRVPGSGQGMGRNLDDASKEATRTAMGTTEGTGSGQGIGRQGRTLLYDEVINLLMQRVEE